MLNLNRYLAALILWLSFVFNIERIDLDVGNTEAFNIASPLYVVIVVVVLLGILMPQVRRVQLWQMQAAAAVLFVVTMWLDGRTSWGGIQTYITLFGLVALLVSVTLATLVGRLTADFIESARALMLTGTDGRVYQGEQASSLIRREMHFARRANRPLSVMVLDIDESSSPVRLQKTVQEVQRILARRYQQVSLARLLARTIRRTDFVVDQSEDGHLILVMPEISREQTTATIDRLNQQIQQRMGVGLQYGVASLPEEGVTFEELIYQAEQRMKLSSNKNSSGVLAEEYNRITEKSTLIESSTSIQVAVDQ